MTTTMNHRDCDHPATKAGRAACRKARAAEDAAWQARIKARKAAADELISVFDDRCGNANDWVMKGAHAFTPFEGTNRYAAAYALLDYFAPSGDDAEDARRRLNGYTITTSPHEILRITLRRFS